MNRNYSQEEKANAEKKLRALRSDVDDRDTTITLLTEELNDTRAAVEALEEELTEWRSKQVCKANSLNSIQLNGLSCMAFIYIAMSSINFSLPTR